LLNWIQSEDVAIVDRGFRDATEFLEMHDLQVEMPSYLKKGTSQHPTDESNMSRLVTKVRWVVEGANEPNILHGFPCVLAQASTVPKPHLLHRGLVMVVCFHCILRKQSVQSLL
jgi:hypothetical protein